MTNGLNVGLFGLCDSNLMITLNVLVVDDDVVHLLLCTVITVWLLKCDSFSMYFILFRTNCSQVTKMLIEMII